MTDLGLRWQALRTLAGLDDVWAAARTQEARSMPISTIPPCRTPPPLPDEADSAPEPRCAGPTNTCFAFMISVAKMNAPPVYPHFALMMKHPVAPTLRQ